MEPMASRMEPIVFIPLTQGKVAVVDFADFELVRNDRWYASSEKSGGPIYARRMIRHPDKPDKQACIQMHTQITGWPSVDHKNGNGLDNRRMNLRQATQAQNMRAFRKKDPNASSKFRGVSWHYIQRKWVTHVIIAGRKKSIGCFISEEEAARAWDSAVRNLGYLEEALNFPPPRPDNFTVL
jgi:hypothetical protein